MAYRVELTARAERDLIDLFERIHAADSAEALRWYRGLKRAVSGLAKSPNRCSPTPEARKLRQLLYGRRNNVYRITFRLVESEKTVTVLHVRHGARRRFRRRDLE